MAVTITASALKAISCPQTTSASLACVGWTKQSVDPSNLSNTAAVRAARTASGECANDKLLTATWQLSATHAAANTACEERRHQTSLPLRKQRGRMRMNNDEMTTRNNSTNGWEERDRPRRWTKGLHTQNYAGILLLVNSVAGGVPMGKARSASRMTQHRECTAE